METRENSGISAPFPDPNVDKERINEPQASITATFAPIITALVESEKILGPDRRWNPKNPTQTRFLDKYFSKRGELEDFSKKQTEGSPLTIDSVASFSVQDVNKFLKDHGLDIQLDKLTPPEFGVASVEEVLVKWTQEGQNASVRAENGTNYEAVRIKDGVSVVNPGKDFNPVVVIDTQSPDYKVIITIPNKTIAYAQIPRFVIFPEGSGLLGRLTISMLMS